METREDRRERCKALAMSCETLGYTQEVLVRLRNAAADSERYGLVPRQETQQERMERLWTVHEARRVRA
jgi:hypothetical protein